MSDSSDGAACSSGWQAEYSAAHRKALGCLARQLERPWYGRDVCDAASSQFVVFSARENIIDNNKRAGVEVHRKVGHFECSDLAAGREVVSVHLDIELP